MKPIFLFKFMIISLILNFALISTNAYDAMACCSLRPASFANTKLYAGETMKDGKLVHLLGYQNKVKNLASSSGKSKGNAMLLPIPAKPGTMTDKNIIDTSKCEHILSDMERSLRKKRKGVLTRGGLFRGRSAHRVQVFDHDIYTIVLADNAKDIPQALKRVRSERRPALNKAIFDAYAKWYPGSTFALCCFNTREEALARPMLWWYEPANPKQLFLPALDAHDGKPPNLKARVEVNHVVMVSTTNWTKDFIDNFKYNSKKPFLLKPSEVRYRSMGAPQSTKKLLPRYIRGRNYGGMLKNGDFIVNTMELRNSNFSIMRKLPPGA